jgi:hypothetical protein
MNFFPAYTFTSNYTSDFDALRHSVAKVNVFYDDFLFMQTDESPAMDLNALLSARIIAYQVSSLKFNVFLKFKLGNLGGSLVSLDRIFDFQYLHDTINFFSKQRVCFWECQF